MVPAMPGKRKKREPTASAWVGAAVLNQILSRAEIDNTAFGKMLGVSHATISRYRSGDRAPDPDTLAAIARTLGVSADELLGLKPLPPIDRVALRRRVIELADALLALVKE